jgi:hypothetical protein
MVVQMGVKEHGMTKTGRS